MIVANIINFKKEINTYLDKVTDNYETIIVNRDNNSGIVVMSLEEYNALIITNKELSSKKNERRIDAALEKFDKKKSFTKTLIEDL